MKLRYKITLIDKQEEIFKFAQFPIKISLLKYFSFELKKRQIFPS